MSGRLAFPQRSWHKRRMANQFTFPNAPSAEQFERMYPDDEACAEDLFRRRWPDGFVCPDCGSGNAVRLKRCVHQCRDCRKQTSVTAGTITHRSHVPLRTWYRANAIALELPLLHTVPQRGDNSFSKQSKEAGSGKIPPIIQRRRGSATRRVTTSARC